MAEKTTLENKPLYAVAGAADVAVETLRELPAKVAGAIKDEKLRTEMRERFSHLPAEAKALREEIPGFVTDAQAKAAELPTRVRELVAQTSREASKTYDELAERGEGVVARLRRDHADPVGSTVAAIRGKVADAADDLADAAGKVADDLGETAATSPAAGKRKAAAKGKPKA